MPDRKAKRARYQIDPARTTVLEEIVAATAQARAWQRDDHWATNLIRDPRFPNQRGNPGTPIYVGQTSDLPEVTQAQLPPRWRRQSRLVGSWGECLCGASTGHGRGPQPHDVGRSSAWPSVRGCGGADPSATSGGSRTPCPGRSDSRWLIQHSDLGPPPSLRGLVQSAQAGAGVESR